jgi:hypothetical protein
LLILYVWYFSCVFKCFPFLCAITMSIAPVIVPYLCPVFSMWFEYPQLLLLFLTACICSSTDALYTIQKQSQLHRNTQNSYTQQKGIKSTHQQNVSNIKTTMIEQQNITYNICLKNKTII